MVEILSRYEQFYRVSTLIIYSTGLLGRLNLMAESKIGLVCGRNSSGFRIFSIKTMKYRLSKRIYL